MNVLKALMVGTLTSALALAAVSTSAQTINRQAKLSWTAPSTCEGGAALSNCLILGYSVQKLIGTTWTQIGTTTSSILTYTDSNLAIGTYAYRVLATGEAGPSKPSNQVTKSFNVPGAPGNLAITVTIVVE
jgi:hypothetical protein